MREYSVPASVRVDDGDSLTDTVFTSGAPHPPQRARRPPPPPPPHGVPGRLIGSVRYRPRPAELSRPLHNSCPMRGFHSTSGPIARMMAPWHRAAWP